MKEVLIETILGCFRVFRYVLMLPVRIAIVIFVVIIAISEVIINDVYHKLTGKHLIQYDKELNFED